MLGGAALLKLDQYLPTQWQNRVDISAMPCTNQCDLPQSLGAAPYVKINGELMSGATIESILERLGQLIAPSPASNSQEGAANE